MSYNTNETVMKKGKIGFWFTLFVTNAWQFVLNTIMMVFVFVYIKERTLIIRFIAEKIDTFFEFSPLAKRTEYNTTLKSLLPSIKWPAIVIIIISLSWMVVRVFMMFVFRKDYEEKYRETLTSEKLVLFPAYENGKYRHMYYSLKNNIRDAKYKDDIVWIVLFMLLPVLPFVSHFKYLTVLMWGCAVVRSLKYLSRMKFCVCGIKHAEISIGYYNDNRIRHTKEIAICPICHNVSYYLRR